MSTKWLLLAVCDGDCDNCRHDDCIDDAGIWDGITEAERAALRDKHHPEHVKVYNRIYKRRRKEEDAEYHKRTNQQRLESYHRAKDARK